MSLTAFQSQKLLYLFRTYFDTDHNGTIEKADFHRIAEKICQLRGWTVGSRDYTITHQLLTGVWDAIRAYDLDQDGRLTEQEWLSLWSTVVTRGSLDEWIRNYRDFMFTALDVTGDGKIDLDEFVTLYGCLAVTSEQSKEAFKKLAMGNDSLSKETFTRRFDEFVFSDDKSMAGNYLFGCCNVSKD